LRQVPKQQNKYPYLIVGNGRLSKHFQHYFSLKGISFNTWVRQSKQSFITSASEADKIMVLVNDDSIESFIKKYKREELSRKKWIHCSGLLSTPIAESAHPLMSFTNELYDLDFYESIIFITEKNRKGFGELFPELPNHSYKIDTNEKAKYHAMCVISGNLTSFVWKIFFDYLQKQGIPSEAAYTYLNAITGNLIRSKEPVTGPFQRNDKKVINKHLDALNGQPLRELYVAFESSFRRMMKENSIEIS
jgi:predicted short-subunit dehydrogenase-like oxidoreductase (DUF2520 family)